MAIQFLNNVDLGFYSSEGLAIQSQSAEPSTTQTGAVYYDTDDNSLKIYDGGWNDIGGSWTIEDGSGNSQTIDIGNTLTVLGGTGVTTTVSATDTLTITATGSLYAFKTISVSGQSDVVADASDDTLTLVAGTNMTITTDAGADSVTFNSTDQYSGTVTSITLAADSGTGTAITSSGTFTFSGGTNVTTSVTGTTVTINSSDQYSGTVTSVGTGDGLTGGTITTSGTIEIDYNGTDNAILTAGDLTGTSIATSDVIWYSDASDDVIKKGNVSALPFDASGGTVTSVNYTHAGNAFTVGGAPVTSSGTIAVTMAGSSSQYIDGEGNLQTYDDGSVTNIATGAGLTGGPITTTGTIDVDYAGSDNVVLAASDGTLLTAAATDKVLMSDATDDNAYYVNLSQLKTYIDSGGTVTSVTSGDTDTITIGGTATAPTVAANTAAVADASANLATGDQIYDFVTGQGYGTGTVTSVTVAGGDGLTSSGSPITTSGTITLALDYAGADNYILVPDTATAAAGDAIAFSDSDDLATVKESTFGAIPMAALTLVKAYIDSATAGALVFQGGYDASTTGPNSSAEKGWTYVVTTGGDGGGYWSVDLEIGDLIIANDDNPSSESDWTEVQKNVDLATASSVGIGNVVPGSTSTVTAPYSSGTATLDVVDSTASQKGAVIVAGGTGVTVTYSSGTATVATDGGSSKKITLNSADAWISVGTSGDVKTYTVDLDNSNVFGSGVSAENIMAECYKASDGTTAFPEIARTTTGTTNPAIDFAFLNSPSDSDYIVLLHNVG